MGNLLIINLKKGNHEKKEFKKSITQQKNNL